MWSRRIFTVVVFLAAISDPAGARSADAVAKLADALATSRSIKVRIQAALLLSRLRDPRAVQSLGRAATSDPDAVVRGFVVSLLGRNPGGTAQSALQTRLVLERALTDQESSVRRKAAAALAELNRRQTPSSGPRSERRTGPMLVAVGHIG